MNADNTHAHIVILSFSELAAREDLVARVWP